MSVAERASPFVPAAFHAWRRAARANLLRGVHPESVVWHEEQLSLGSPAWGEFSDLTLGAGPDGGSVGNGGDGADGGGDRGDVGASGRENSDRVRVPRSFVKLAASVACHRDPHRWDLLYRVLYRLSRGERELLTVATDPDVHRVMVMDKAVRRAAHKMTAFVRFRRATPAGADHAGESERYVAWFEPAHDVVERTAPFFMRRFAGMRWSILTPRRCAHWDGTSVSFSDGVSRAAAPSSDDLEELWRDYYANIFNPARLAPGVMRGEMPKGYWVNLPEAVLIPDLIRTAPARVAEMIERVARPPLEPPTDIGSTTATTPRARARATTLPPETSWHPVHDPGALVARQRELRVGAGSARRITVDGVDICTGVAGWTDPSLLAPGVFYPADATSAEARLRYYAARYAMVEVDSTYYALPRRENSVLWVQRTPADFLFNVKANALMTGHASDVRQLPDWLRRALPDSLRGAPRVYGSDLSDGVMDEVWSRFLSALEPLQRAGKLGAVFLQFPRWFEPGAAAHRVLRLAARRLGDVRGAVEFRNPAWVDGDEGVRTFALLQDLGLAYTVVDAPPGTRSSMPPVVRITRPDLAVVRLHGRRVETWEKPNRPVTERYRYLYDAEQIAMWADTVIQMASMMRQGILQVSYNNNHANYATTNAAEFGDDLRSRRRGTWAMPSDT